MQSPRINRECLQGAPTYLYLNTDQIGIVGVAGD